ncbi:hypothetical protein J2S21_004394, partial [Peribacillus cavernae]|nr:hypothetical protein [Peribacillus cavernae]
EGGPLLGRDGSEICPKWYKNMAKAGLLGGNIHQVERRV